MEPLEEAVPERLAQAEIDAAVSVARRVAENIRKAVQVKDGILEHVTVTMLSEGHILVEDYPGVGKTALARALSRSIDCQFARVQCTADLLPADIVGTQIYNQRESRFEFRDRKSTRLNSSHANISYAVFCLNKKSHAVKLLKKQVPV